MALQFPSALDAPNASLEPLISGYRPLHGVFDEMMDGNGRIRAHWQPFLTTLAALGSDEINRRFAAADRYLRDSGVFYRVYEDAAGIERPWPLSHIPLIIEPGEWRQLEAGLIQRAELLEAVLADSYGPGTLTRDGRLPAALIAGNPEFLRPLVGVEPPGGAHLRFYAVDIGRGSDGRWWVLNDRAQAPSGAGYAIENRLALSRAIPDIYRKARVERVAPFFQAFQAELSALNRRDDARISLLTPGPMNETYFEHAYLARYLGLLLVEGEDLIVQDDGVFIRTVSGLRRTEVLLRRIDADFADPLELNAASRLGVAGLLQAVRDGKVIIINALGAGLVEARAMLAFLPALAPIVLGAELKMSNVATWWLGRADMREEMIGKLDSMVIASAFTEQLPNAQLGSEILGARLDAAQRQALMQSIRDRGIDYVAQEAVTLSSMPVWRDGRLQPRPFTLRLFLARAGERWQVLPAGFVRIAEDIDARAVSLQRGAATADAWVLAHGPVAETTLLPTAERMPVQRASGLLPSRAADNLFWVGRYVERAEATLRLVRAIINRVAEADDAAAPVIATMGALLAAWDAIPPDSITAPPAPTARAVLTRDGSGRIAAAACELGAFCRFCHSRPLLAGCLAGDQRPRQIDCSAACGRPDRKRDCRARGSSVTHHRGVIRSGAGKHDATCRLAFSRARPPHRTRAADLPAHSRLGAIRHRRWRARRAVGARRQPDHLSAALCDDRRAGAGHRPRRARSEQSAFGALPARSHRGASTRAAETQLQRSFVAGSANRRGHRHPAAHRGSRRRQRDLDRRYRAGADEIVGRHHRGLSRQQ